MSDFTNVDIDTLQFKIGDEVEFLPIEEINANEDKYHFSKYSDQFYEEFAKYGPIKIKRIDPKNSKELNFVVFKLINAKCIQESFYYPFEIKDKYPFAVDLI